MSQPYTRLNAQIAVGRESDQGSAASVDRTLGKIVDDGDMPDPEVDWLEERTIQGGNRELSGKEPGQNTYDGGSLTILPVDEYPFEFLLGETMGDTTTGEIHVANQSLPPTETIEATYYGASGQDDFVRTFTGVAPNSGTIGVDNESQLTIDFDLQALGVTTGTSPSTGITTVDDTRPFLFLDAESALTYAGTTYARVTDFEWDLSNNLNPRYYIQPDDPEDPYEVHYGNAGHAVTATILPTDDSLYADLTGRDDAGSASIAFETPDNRNLTFNFDSVGLQEAPHGFPSEGTPEVEVSLLPDTGYIAYDPDTSS